MSSTSWWSASGKAPSCSIARPTSANGSRGKESRMNEPATVRVAHVGGRPPRQGALYWLALGTFAIGTEGFMIAAILPNIAADLVVSVALAGSLISIFALAYALSSPILTALTGRVPTAQTVVTRRVGATLGCRTTRTRSRSVAVTIPAPAPAGRPANRPTTAAADKMATPTKVIRHPTRLPTTAPSGTPTAIATVSPAFTIAMARPRLSGGARAPASAFAFGVYKPAAHARSTRAAARPQ